MLIINHAFLKASEFLNVKVSLVSISLDDIYSAMCLEALQFDLESFSYFVTSLYLHMENFYGGK